MARGRKPDLQVVQDLKGRPNQTRPLKPGLMSTGEIRIPEHLPPDAEAVIEHIKTSMPPEVFGALDVYALTCFAYAWSMHKAAVEGIAADGYISASHNGVESPHPWTRLVREAAMVMAKYGPELGLSPLSRQRLANPDREPNGKFGKLLNERRA